MFLVRETVSTVEAIASLPGSTSFSVRLVFIGLHISTYIVTSPEPAISCPIFFCLAVNVNVKVGLFNVSWFSTNMYFI